MSLRLKGLECTLRFTGPDGGEDSLVKIKEWEINAKGEILKEDYTGAVTPEFDSVEDGIEVRFTVHHHDPEVLDFFQRVRDKRMRRADAAGKFSAVGILRWPSGRTRKLLVPDIEFGDLPFKVGGRKVFTESAINGMASSYKVIG